MKSWLRVCLGAAAIVWGGSSFASTVTYTEGGRDPIAGSIYIPDWKANNPDGYVLGEGSAVGTTAGEWHRMNLHGDIKRGYDRFAFTSTEAFAVIFNFDGYETGSGSVPISGLVSLSSDPNTVIFSLSGFAPTSFTTSVTGGSSLLFWGGPGDYVFDIDGGDTAGLANYDLSIMAVNEKELAELRAAAIPLPMTANLMLASLGVMGLVARRRRRSARHA